MPEEFSAFFKGLLNAAAFRPKSIQPPDSWVGHMPFAAWVTKQFRPLVMVELGTHTGNSYFSFCQAVAEEKLDTRCFAIDTWQGDKHAGEYSEVVYHSVSQHNSENYSMFSTLLRMSFNDALVQFSDNSISMLHIDGLHTYEAVKHDFESWLPKLSPGALVLFHDTSVRERGFGVWKFWEELAETYRRRISFTHCNGLGVMQLDTAKEGELMEWLAPAYLDKAIIVDYFDHIGDSLLAGFHLNEEIATGKSKLRRACNKNFVTKLMLKKYLS